MLSTPPTQDWLFIGECFYLLLIAGVVVALWRSRHHILSRGAVLPIVLALLALLLRFVAHPGPSDIRAVLGEAAVRRAGWGAALHLLSVVLPQHDETIWTLNRIVGALSVPLLYVVMRRRFADPTVAAGGAAALAVTPLIVRLSASDAPYILLCAAFLGAVVAWDRYVESGAISLLALAFGLLTAAMQLRPETPWLALPAALLALAPPSANLQARLRRPAFLCCGLLFVAINVPPTLWAFVGHTRGAGVPPFVLVGSLFGSPWADPDMTPAPLAALLVVGVLAVLHQRQRPALLWLAAALVALPFAAPATGSYAAQGLRLGVALPSVMPAVAQHADARFHLYSSARYHLPAMYLACGLAGVGVATLLALLARLVRRPLPAARLVALAVLCLAAWPRFDVLRRMWTPQREYEFFRSGVSHLDPHCRLVTLERTSDAGFVPFQYLVSDGLLDISDFLAHPPSGECFVYYRCGNCYALDLVPEQERRGFVMHPACRALEERYRLEPIIESPLPALPYRGEVYSRDPVLVGFYRLCDATAVGGCGAADARPRTPAP